MYQSPVNVYVLWHQEYEEGKSFATSIYSNLSRNIAEPLDRGIGIPVFFRSEGDERDKLLMPDVERAAINLIVALIDTKMILSPEWTTYIGQVNKLVGKDTILIPVAISESSYNIDAGIDATNFLRLFNYDGADKTTYLLYSISYEICRRLYNIDRPSDEDGISQRAVQLFLSHAKKDGEEKAKLLRDFFEQETGINTFFDTHDIATGYDFRKEIAANIEQAVLLVLHTDAYGSREWCRREVLRAKEVGTPIIVINMFEKGENRSFPYMGNVPTIHWSEESNDDSFKLNLAKNIVLEALRYKFQRSQIVHFLSYTGFSDQVLNGNILPNAPEMLSLIHLPLKGKVIYPDPPLGSEELELLYQLNSEYEFITPLHFQHKINQVDLKNKKVAISISKSENITSLGLSVTHLQDAMIEVSRHLMAAGATVVYGGDVRYSQGFNFAQLLFDLVRTYNLEYETQQKVENYLPYPLSKLIDDETRVKLIKIARLHLLDAPDDVSDHTVPEEVAKSLTVEHQLIWARGLTAMRTTMNNEAHARIVIGGKTRGYRGKLPGLVEETMITIASNTPVYLVGAFGGCAAAIIKALRQEIPQELTHDYQCQDAKYSAFMELYNNHYQENISYDDVIDFFHTKGKEPGYGLNNGLSNEENEQLFTAIHQEEIISLVLKGLSNV